MSGRARVLVADCVPLDGLGEPREPPPLPTTLSSKIVQDEVDHVPYHDMLGGVKQPPTAMAAIIEGRPGVVVCPAGGGGQAGMGRQAGARKDDGNIRRS